jgi:D-alanyl-D-alanine carboxypeptidase
MTSRRPASAAARPTRSLVLAALVGGAVLVGVLAADPGTGSGRYAAQAPAASASDAGAVPAAPAGPLREDDRVQDGQTAFDARTPAVTNLDDALLAALRRAATDAARDGVELRVNSGWRSAAHQEQLLRDAVRTYGSAEEAARWVATPETSPHVSGDAVDIGPPEAASWLSEHGSALGLCQVYENEPWHYELRPVAVDHGCPGVYDDPTHDPRMQQ